MRHARMRLISVLVGAIALFALAMFSQFVPCLFSLLGTGESPSDPPEHQKHVEKGSPPASPAEVVLAQGNRELLTVPEPCGADTCQVLRDNRGRQWVFFARFKALQYMVRVAGKWGERMDITPPGWEFFDRLIAVEDRKGNPIVVLAGGGGTVGSALAAIHWTGEGWGTPVRLDHWRGNQITALRDSQGRVHVAYEGRLTPSEDYSIGALWVYDGVFPNKCFHVLWDGKKWSTPQPTSGRGRFSVRNLVLGEEPGGRVYLSCLVEPFGTSRREPKYVACQFWDGGWGQFERVSGRIPDLTGGFLVVDGWGQEHVWVNYLNNSRWEYLWPRRAKAVPADAPSGSWPLDLVVVRMPDGRLAASGHGKLRVWSGAKWSTSLRLGDLPHLGSTPDGNLIAWDWRGTDLVIQEVLVKNSVCPQTAPDE